MQAPATVIKACGRAAAANYQTPCYCYVLLLLLLLLICPGPVLLPMPRYRRQATTGLLAWYFMFIIVYRLVKPSNESFEAPNAVELAQCIF